MALLGAILFTQSYVQTVSVKQAIHEQKNAMQVATNTWKSGGVSVTLTTTRLEGESDEDFAGRHKRAYAAMLIAFPKDP